MTRNSIYFSGFAAGLSAAILADKAFDRYREYDAQSSADVARFAVACYILNMTAPLQSILSDQLASELENKFFWWEPVGSQRRSNRRIVAQAMNYASFEDVLHLERQLGSYSLAQVMLSAEPGWISDRSWEFWRGRLVLATGCAIPEEPPRRSFNAQMY